MEVAQCEDYQLPFYNNVPQDPSFEDMFQVQYIPIIYTRAVGTVTGTNRTMAIKCTLFWCPAGQPNVFVGSYNLCTIY